MLQCWSILHTWHLLHWLPVHPLPLFMLFGGSFSFFIECSAYCKDPWWKKCDMLYHEEYLPTLVFAIHSLSLVFQNLRKIHLKQSPWLDATTAEGNYWAVFVIKILFFGLCSVDWSESNSIMTCCMECLLMRCWNTELQHYRIKTTKTVACMLRQDQQVLLYVEVAVCHCVLILCL